MSEPKKKRRGRPKLPRDEDGNIIRPEPEVESPPDEITDAEAAKPWVAWAEAVKWVLENNHQKSMTLRRAGTSLRYGMWQTAQEFPKEFAFQMVPRAMATLDKFHGSQAGDATTMAEEHAVEELDKLIDAAVKEAAG